MASALPEPISILTTSHEETRTPVAEDKNLTCRDCANTFVFTAGEQAFFTEKGLSDPIRCPDCRRLRKQQRALESPSGTGGGIGTTFPPRSTDSRPSGGAPRSDSPSPRPPRASDDDSRSTAGFRKPKIAGAKFTPPRKEQAAAPVKEKRPGNRRDEEKLLLNWKEEAGLEDLDTDADWLPVADPEGEE